MGLSLKKFGNVSSCNYISRLRSYDCTGFLFVSGFKIIIIFKGFRTGMLTGLLATKKLRLFPEGCSIHPRLLIVKWLLKKIRPISSEFLQTVKYCCFSFFYVMLYHRGYWE